MPFLARVTCLLIASTCAIAQAPELERTLKQRVDAYYQPLVEMGMFSGTVLIARGGKILVEQAYGLADRDQKTPNTIDTKFKLMSVSKSLTAVAAMRLVQDGTLALTDPVAKHLPDWPANWPGVTVHDLLDHTSGIPNLCPIIWSRVHFQKNLCGLELWRDVAKDCAKHNLLQQPGTQYAYSNFNFELVGAVIEAASGETFRACVQRTLLDPAKMQSTGFDDGSPKEGLAFGYIRKAAAPDKVWQDMSCIQAAGGFFSTIGDLYRLDRALYTDTVVDAATRHAMFTPRTGFYACGWSNRPIHGHLAIQHSGGNNGYVADFLRFVDDDACVIVLSNYAFAPIIRLSNDTAALLFDKPVTTPAVLTTEQLDACGGIYTAGASTIVVQRSGTLLRAYDIRAGSERQSGRILIPLGNNRFATAMGNQEMMFAEHGLTLQNGRNQRTLARAQGVKQAWADAAGTYEAPKQLGDVDLRTTGAHPVMEVRGSDPRILPIVPVSKTTAIVLYSEGGGTMLHRKGTDLTWTNASGRKFLLTRR